jgi:hypothetical protein
MTKDEALKMAIEALNQAAEWLAGDDKFDVYNLDKAYFACKEALEQPAFGECGNKACGGHGACYCEEQPAQEPVATIQQFERKWIDKEALEQPAQEPVAWMYEWEDEKSVKLTFHPDSVAKTIPLYTHPHQWQGLTDEEKLSSIRKWAENNTKRGQVLIILCDFIELALKDKNT